jgi:hypothetical protein
MNELPVWAMKSQTSSTRLSAPKNVRQVNGMPVFTANSVASKEYVVLTWTRQPLGSRVNDLTAPLRLPNPPAGRAIEMGDLLTAATFRLSASVARAVESL